MKQKIFRFWWLLAALTFIALFSLAVMALWNWLLPDIAGLGEITFLQALGLLALSRILLGGLGGAGRVFAGRAIRGRGHVNPFREKWEKMSDEERRDFFTKQHPFHSRFFGGCDGREPDQNKDKE
jgi:hypothetical protein